ncbi:MAG: hypothetical protein QXV82_10015 [Ignisphaera sp.]
MPDLLIEYTHISNTTYLSAVVVLRAVDEALPPPEAAVSGPYIAGVLRQGEKSSERRSFNTGKHYVIVGVYQSTTATVNVRIKDIATNKTIKEKTVTTSNTQYYVIGFGVGVEDPGVDGVIAPGVEPEIETGGSSPSTTLPIDPNLIKDMMSMMMQMMMMMVMMQMMVGMMRGMAGAFGGV